MMTPNCRRSSLRAVVPALGRRYVKPMKIPTLSLLAVVALACSIASAELPAINDVTIDERGGFVVNGEPFFPVLLYDAKTDEATLEQLREFGFNVLTVGDAKVAATLPAQGFYAAMHVNAKLPDVSGVLLAIGPDSPAMYVKENLIGKTREDNAKAKEHAGGRPVMNAIGYWENEPEGVKAGKLYPKEKYDDLAAAIEVPAPYLYPVPYQPISTVGDAVAAAKKAGGAGKPVLPIVQLFAWDAKDRYPTPAELRAMAFASLIEGASGIGYYSYGSVTGQQGKTIAEVQPELWASVKGLNKEIVKAAKALRGGVWNNEVSAVEEESVRWKAVVILDGGTIVAVNQSDQPRKLVLKVGAEMPLPEPWKVEGGEATVELKPFDVVVTTYGTR